MNNDLKTVMQENMIKEYLRRIIELTGYEIRKIKNESDESLYISLFGSDSVKQKKFYNISAGGHFDFGCGIHHPLWRNVDIKKKWDSKSRYNPEKDIIHDLQSLEPLPIATGYAELVYSRITIEHITNDASMIFFKEVKRILKRGGVFRIATPNIDLDYRAYLNNDKHYFSWASHRSIEQAFLEHFADTGLIKPERFKELLSEKNLEDVLDYCTTEYQIDFTKHNRENHINWWNPKKLEQMLRSAGFNTIYVSAAEQSICPVLRNGYYFDNVFQKVMLYMEVIND